MKKTLLLAAAMVACLGANAQAEYAGFNETLKLENKVYTNQAAETAIGSTSLADATIGAEDTYQGIGINTKDAAGNSITNYDFDGLSVAESDKGGIQGKSNPKDVDGNNPAVSLTAPKSGAYFEFKSKGDGYLYVIGKFTSNKNYAVFEEGAAIPFFYSTVTAQDVIPGKDVVSFDLTGTGSKDEDGIERITLTDHSKGILWPEQIVAGITGANGVDTVSTVAVVGNPVGTNYSSWKKIGKNAVGVVGFPIFSDLTYIVTAGGSKLSGLGFVTSTTPIQNIKASDAAGTVSYTLLDKGQIPNGIKTIKANTAKSDDTLNAMDPMYNLAGQRVSGAYKGIVIQNGHKFFNVK